jgi:hypothetical protein
MRVTAVNPVCNFSTDWSSTILMASVAGVCCVWTWKSLALQIAHSVERKRTMDAQYDRERTLRHLAEMRKLALLKRRETLRGYEQQRLVDEAACYLEAIQRLQGVYVAEQEDAPQQAAA